MYRMIITRRFTSILFMFFELFLFIKANGDKCNILSLQGGGDRGAYQAGVIKGLAYFSNDTQWDVISGISVGAVNGAAISIFAKGQEKEASDFMISKWRNMRGPGSVYENWKPYGIITGLLSKSGILSTEPLKGFLSEILTQNVTLQRELIVGATNLKTGNYDTFDFKSLSRDEYLAAILSSASVPFIFPNTNIKNNFYADGGGKFSIDVPSAIQKCRDLGFTDDKILVDVVLCVNKKISKIQAKNLNTIEVMIRSFEIIIYEQTTKDLEEVGHIFPNVTFRYVVRPTKRLPTITTLEFNPSAIKTMIDYGFEDGKNSVAAGVGKTNENLKREAYIEKARIILNKKDISYNDAYELMMSINQSKSKDFERLKTKFLGN